MSQYFRTKGFSNLKISDTSQSESGAELKTLWSQCLPMWFLHGRNVPRKKRAVEEMGPWKSSVVEEMGHLRNESWERSVLEEACCGDTGSAICASWKKWV